MAETGIQVWNKVLSTALQTPGIKIDRMAFLKKEFSKYGKAELLAEKAPIAVYDKDIVKKVANGVISYRIKLATSISFASGLPGGWTLPVTISADIAQQYYHLLVAAQELAYIYGMPSLLNKNGEFDSNTQNILTLLVGVASGVGLANRTITNLSKNFAIQVAKRLPQKALTKTIWYPVVKQVAKWLGVSITKSSFARGVSKFIPIVGGGLSAGLTYATFKPMLNKLEKHLYEDMQYYKSCNYSKNFSQYISEAEDVQAEYINE